MPRYFTLATFASICCVVFVLSGCSKKSKKDAQPNYTEKMGGIRNWHGWRDYSHRISSSSNATSGGKYAYPDTSFSLILVSNTTVNFLGRTLEYDTATSKESVYYFGEGFYGLTYKNGMGLVYYPEKDQIIFVDEGTSHNSHDWTRYYTF